MQHSAELRKQVGSKLRRIVFPVHRNKKTLVEKIIIMITVIRLGIICAIMTTRPIKHRQLHSILTAKKSRKVFNICNQCNFLSEVNVSVQLVLNVQRTTAHINTSILHQNYNWNYSMFQREQNDKQMPTILDLL